MNVKDVMSTKVETVTPNTTVRDAASRMKQKNIGTLPIAENGQTIGFLTDRDIALRCCAEGKDPVKTQVRSIMTPRVVDCQETQDIEQAIKLMEKEQVRRLLVTDKTKHTVGIFSLSDLARKSQDDRLTGRLLHEISATYARAAT